MTPNLIKAQSLREQAAMMLSEATRLESQPQLRIVK